MENAIKYWGEIKNDKGGKKEKKKRPNKNILLEEEIILEVATDPKKPADKIVNPRNIAKIG